MPCVKDGWIDGIDSKYILSFHTCLYLQATLNKSLPEMRTMKAKYEDILWEAKRKIASCEENIADLSR